MLALLPLSQYNAKKIVQNILLLTIIFFLIVLAVNLITTPRNTTAAVGKSIVLRCNATGLPTPDISWGRERGKLDKKRFRQLANGNLHIRDIKMTDAGQYFCLAANSHDLKEVKVTLRVIGKRFVL